MKKLILDEMNINDIINRVDLDELLYTTDSLGVSHIGNIIKLEYDGKSIIDLADLTGLDTFNNEYIVLSISSIEPDNKRYIYLKQIPML
jgi:hypothetical protein